MRFKLALYDWNGTTLNDLDLGYKCMVETFQMLGGIERPPTFAEYRQGLDNSRFADFYYRHGLPRTVSPEEINEFLYAFYRKMLKCNALRLHDGAQSLLLYCRSQGIPNVMVSASKDNVPRYLSFLGIRDYFHALKLNGSNGWHKGIGLKEALEEFGVAPEEAFYLDDTFDGIQSAKQLGIVSVGFTKGFNSEERIRAAGPDHIVHSLFEVIDLLQLEAVSI